MWNYETLKQLASEQGWRVGELLALAAKNDPFYTGRPAEMGGARWFANLWSRFGYGRGVHLRRIHYQIVSQNPPVVKPDGSLYENTERDWDYLNEVSKWARYLELVPADHFVDRRNPEAIIYAHWPRPGSWDYEDPTPGYKVDGNWDLDSAYYRLPCLPELDSLPSSLPEMPAFAVSGYETVQQAYHVEIWAEKTTQNDILNPLCSRHRVNLVAGAGELSITAVVEFFRRVRGDSRPARILYVSDFDPAGLGMPVSIARKIEFFQRTRGFDDLDIRLEPVMLTAKQTAQYALPRTPIKESELRKAKFEESHGEGATELDALEALYPGEMSGIVERAILNYYDPALAERAREQKRTLASDLEEKRGETLLSNADELSDLEADYQALLDDFEKTRERFLELISGFQPEIDQFQERLEGIMARERQLYGEIRDGLEAAHVDPDDYPLPQPDLPAESDGLPYVFEVLRASGNGDNP